MSRKILAVVIWLNPTRLIFKKAAVLCNYINAIAMPFIGKVHACLMYTHFMELKLCDAIIRSILEIIEILREKADFLSVCEYSTAIKH